MDTPDLLADQTPKAPVGFRILELIAENIKRLEVVEIRPTEDVVEITGRNGQGKTSVLDAIWWALDGAGNISPEPIRRGAEKGRISLDLGDMIVTRVFRSGEAGLTTSLSVRTREGAEYRQPQKLVDTFFNALSLDPLAFLRMKEPDKFTLVRQFVPEVDFEAIEELNKGDYARRRDENAEAKRLRALATKLVMPDEHALPEQPIDLDALQDELEAAGRTNGEIETRRVRREGVRQQADAKALRSQEMLAEAAELRQRATDIVMSADMLKHDAADLMQKLETAEPLPEPINTREIMTRLNAARGTNTAIDIVRQRGEAEANAQKAEAASKALTETMDARVREANDLIAAAKLPVEGLTLTPAGAVLLNELPFEQASDAEQLRVSIALAMAMNPRLRVIRVRDGSLLDADGMALIREMAKEHGYQVWVERVASDSPTGFELVAGRVRKPAAAEVAP